MSTASTAYTDYTDYGTTAALTATIASTVSTDICKCMLKGFLQNFSPTEYVHCTLYKKHISLGFRYIVNIERKLYIFVNYTKNKLFGKFTFSEVNWRLFRSAVHLPSVGVLPVLRWSGVRVLLLPVHTQCTARLCTDTVRGYRYTFTVQYVQRGRIISRLSLYISL